MENITIIFEENDVTTKLIVRSKTGAKPRSNNYNIRETNTTPHIPINSTLDLLDLERVPFNELVPGYKRILNGDSLIGQICNICQEDYKVKEYKRELVCKHNFHKKCIDKWIKTKLTCPLCRTSM